LISGKEYKKLKSRVSQGEEGAVAKLVFAAGNKKYEARGDINNENVVNIREVKMFNDNNFTILLMSALAAEAMARKRMNIRDKTVSIFMAVLFIASLVVTSIKLTTYMPTGFYTPADMVIVTVSALLLGISATYLLFVDVKPALEKKSEHVSSVEKASASNYERQIPDISQDKIEGILGVLKGSEPKIIKTLLDFGEMNQAELAVRTGIPRSSLSRILADLERRGLVIRYDFGTSKMIKLGEKFVNESTSTG